ncbi:MAG TPA: hypothetical protein P5110_03865 [Candidatus Omnitrophota bacterium]|nr:hypothetical protein [Candidatus Omnitrophota bacterium]
MNRTDGAHLSDEQRYALSSRKKEQEWEALCCRCGACCGAFEDPCQHLQKTASGTFICGIYEERFGVQRSVGGREFRCVPIRTILDKYWTHDCLCAYKKQLKSIKGPGCES